MKEPWWAWLVAIFIDLITKRQRQLGRDEVSKEQQEAAEALREDYDEINNDGRTLDDALGRLRNGSASARKRKGDVPKA